MATIKQQQDEMVNTFVASIPAMQTDIALLKQDTSFLKAASTEQTSTQKVILKSIGDLSVVSKAEFTEYKKDEAKRRKDEHGTINDRLTALEQYNEDTSPGTKFSNALVSRWTTFLILLLLTAAVIALVGRFIPIGSIGV
jgi:hypothetical protein